MTAPGSPEQGNFPPRRDHKARVHQWVRSVRRDARLAEDRIEQEVQRRVDERVKGLGVEKHDKGEFGSLFKPHLFAMEVRGDEIRHKSIGKDEGIHVRTARRGLKQEIVGASWRTVLTSDDMRVNYDSDMSFKGDELDSYEVKFKSDLEARTAPSTSLKVTNNGQVSFSLSWQGGEYPYTVAQLLGSTTHPLLVALERADTRFFGNWEGEKSFTLTMDKTNLNDVSKVKVSFEKGKEKKEKVEFEYDGATDTFGNGEGWSITNQDLQSITSSLVSFIPTQVSPYPKTHQFEEQRYYRELLMPGEYTVTGRGIVPASDQLPALSVEEQKLRELSGEINSIWGPIGRKLYRAYKDYYDGNIELYARSYHYSDISYHFFPEKEPKGVHIQFGDAWRRADIFKSLFVHLSSDGKVSGVDLMWHTYNGDHIPDILRSPQFPALREFISNNPKFQILDSNILRFVFNDQASHGYPKISFATVEAFVGPFELRHKALTDVPYNESSNEFSNPSVKGFEHVSSKQFLKFVEELSRMVPQATFSNYDKRGDHSPLEQLSEFNVPIPPSRI